MSAVEVKSVVGTVVYYALAVVFYLLLVAGPVLFVISLYQALFTPAPIVSTILNGLGPLFVSILMFAIGGYMVVGPRVN
jgi:type IV secretory pathway VirB6-like protein